MDSEELMHVERRNEGFTLIELLTVIAILGILMGLVTGAVTIARKRSLLAQAKVDIDQFGAAITAYVGKYGDHPPSSIEDEYQISGNELNSGIESLLAHITRDQNFSEFDFQEERLSNVDNDLLGNQEVYNELRWVFGDNQLREYLDPWDNPYIYVETREYGRQFKVHHKEGTKPTLAEAGRSEKSATFHSPTTYQIWSAGPKGINENGEGDDVHSW
ncbi:MAG: prepilin-type N-terminal cleavage/methylation domain-containing protein [Planctomycetota bacterium]